MNEHWDDAFCRLAVAKGYLTIDQAKALRRDAAEARENRLEFNLSEAAALRGLLEWGHVDEVVGLLASEPTRTEVEALAAAIAERGLASPAAIRGMVDRWRAEAEGPSPALSLTLIHAGMATAQQLETILAGMRPAGIPFKRRDRPAVPPAIFDGVTKVLPDRPQQPPLPIRPPSPALAPKAPAPKAPARTQTPRPFPAVAPSPPAARPARPPRSSEPEDGDRSGAAGSGVGPAIAGLTALAFAIGAYYIAKSSTPVIPPTPSPAVTPAPSRPTAQPIAPVGPTPAGPVEAPSPPVAVPPPPDQPEPEPAREEPPRPTPRPSARPSPVFGLLERAVHLEDDGEVREAEKVLLEAGGVDGVSTEGRRALEEARRKLSTREEEIEEARAMETRGELAAARKAYLEAYSCDALAAAVLSAIGGPADQAAARECLEPRFGHLVQAGIDARADLRLVEALTAYDIALALHRRMGMSCDASGPKSSRDELARRLRDLLPADDASGSAK